MRATQLSRVGLGLALWILAARVAPVVARAAPLALGPVQQAEAHPSPARPNLVVVLVDDLGWQDVSLPLHTSPTPRNAQLHTPNVERLAARGVTFPQGYASAPVCSPTRASLMTGVSPAQHHITYWLLHAGRDTSAEFPGLRPPAWDLDGLQPGDDTLAHRLAAGGYRTIHVGKAHLGAVGTAGADPLALGFERNVAGHGAGAPSSYLGTREFRRHPRGIEADAQDVVWDVPGLERWHGQEVFLTGALAAEACREVREAVTDGVPFFLHFAPYAVHTPITANPARLARYADLPEREAAYASMIETVDAALGALLDLLEELELEDDTWVVFTSDNGGLAAHGRDGPAHTQNAPLRSGKGSYYEGGLRVPWIVAGPGVRGAPRRCDVPIVTHDLFPTLLAWAGLSNDSTSAGADGASGDRDEAPSRGAGDARGTAASRPRLGGCDLTPLLTGLAGREADFPERDLVWHQPHYWGLEGPGIEPFSALRHADWKLVQRHADGGLELYDLARDPGESTDLSAREADRVAALAARLAAWLEAAGAQPSIDTRTGEPIALPGR